MGLLNTEIIYKTMENRSGFRNFSLDQTTGDSGIAHISWNFEYILFAVYLGIFAIMGIVGNIPVLMVYFHKNDNAASNTFIKVLAILDLLVCLFLMPYTMIYELHLVNNDVFCRLFELLRHFIIISSNITLVAIAVERYIAVCRLTVKMSVQNVQKGMFFIIVLSIIIASPSVLLFAVVSKNDVKTMNCSFNHQYLTEEYFCHFTYSLIGETWATIYQGVLVIVFFIGFLLIVILYIIVYVVLWQKTKLRKRMMSRSSREMSFTSEPSQSVIVNENGKSETWMYPKIQSLDGKQSSNVSEPRMVNDDSEESSKDATNKTSDAATARASPVQQPLKQRSSKSDGEKRSKRRNHRRTAKMLFLCTVIYLVTWLPFWTDIFGATNNILLRYMFFIGNATNPIVYGVVNEQVRKSFKKLIGELFGKCTSLFSRKK